MVKFTLPMNNLKPIRTRYAPSPTGFQHIGGIRTAVINYLLAKSLGGDFVLRIEDTDVKRYVSGAEDYIIRALKWLDINYDEGPDIGGKFAPYRQSERKEIYIKYALELITKGKAYYAFDTEEELELYREKEEKKGTSFLYNYLNRDKLKNSFSIDRKKIEKLLESHIPYVIRLNLPENETINFDDAIRGQISVSTSQLEDKILLKSDGTATYHLASVVDDTLMEISHVIRGEEWLPSAPIHHYLYKAFNWEATKPIFAHLPLILNPDGQGKLSKRKLKDANIPIFPLSWKNKDGRIVKGLKEEGFLPEALINTLVLLGWHDNTDIEIYNRNELLRSFDFNKIQKSGAKFDYDKAKWINAKHIQMTHSEYLREYFIELFPQYQKTVSKENLILAIDLIKARISTMSEINNFTYLFDKNFQTEKSIRFTLNEATKKLIYDSFYNIDTWTPFFIKETINEIVTNKIVTSKEFYKTIRILLTGEEFGPDLVDIMSIIGKEECLNRLT
jgi:glutamyl-tRNA synthetase